MNTRIEETEAWLADCGCPGRVEKVPGVFPELHQLVTRNTKLKPVTSKTKFHTWGNGMWFGPVEESV